MDIKPDEIKISDMLAVRRDSEYISLLNKLMLALYAVSTRMDGDGLPCWCCDSMRSGLYAPSHAKWCLQARDALFPVINTNVETKATVEPDCRTCYFHAVDITVNPLTVVTKCRSVDRCVDGSRYLKIPINIHSGANQNENYVERNLA